MGKRLFILSLDNMEINGADQWDPDTPSTTMDAVWKSSRLFIPNLTSLGLFSIDGMHPGHTVKSPSAAYGKLRASGNGRDLLSGYWETGGVIHAEALPVYPDGFPPVILQELENVFPRGILGGMPGTPDEVLMKYGRDHIRSGAVIVYTSSDSVMRIAAHNRVLPERELYALCAAVRKIMQGRHGIGRVIAEPFTDAYPYKMDFWHRRVFALPAPAPTMLDLLRKRWFDIIAVGNIYDLYAGRGISQSIHTSSNEEAMRQLYTLARLDFTGLCFANLSDFFYLYLQRGDYDGYAHALSTFDEWLGNFTAMLRRDDIVMIMSGKSGTPSGFRYTETPSAVPFLIFGDTIQSGINLGTRETLADISATTLAFFDLPQETQGQSFLESIAL